VDAIWIENFNSPFDGETSAYGVLAAASRDVCEKGVMDESKVGVAPGVSVIRRKGSAVRR